MDVMGTHPRVALLHGLARSSRSLFALEQALRRRGMSVRSFDYPSRRATIVEHAKALRAPILHFAGDEPVSFVTHSMGGIVLRALLHPEHGDARLRSQVKRTVMLAPPNEGSAVVDRLAAHLPLKRINGPANLELRTDGLPSELGPVDFAVGVIAGTRSLNPLTAALLDRPNDGKVSVKATKVEGMADHIALPVTHTFMMNAPLVVAQTLAFLETGRFEPNLTLSRALATYLLKQST